jgi:flagellar motor component MotA
MKGKEREEKITMCYEPSLLLLIGVAAFIALVINLSWEAVKLVAKKIKKN